LQLRGSLQHAVRAPNVTELDTPLVPAEYDLDLVDPCARNSPKRRGVDAAAVEALCVAQGMPEAVLERYRSFETFVPGVSGGNPGLQPEEADTWTMGLVVQSPFAHPWIAGAQLAIDWYQIKIEDTIEFVEPFQFIPFCYDRNYNPDLALDNVFCSKFAREPSAGQIVDAVSIYQNLASQQTTGVDMQLDWVVAAGPGQLNLNWYLGWLDSQKQHAAPDATGVESVGRIGGFAGARPDWKWILTLGYAFAGFDVSGRWRFIESMRDVEIGTYEVPDYSYYDLYAGYAVDSGRLEGLSLHLGIENLTDKDPPIFPSWSEVNTDPSQYEIFGRRYFLSASYAL
jgi:outer membrane receptor protein involved in Fe transport